MLRPTMLEKGRLGHSLTGKSIGGEDFHHLGCPALTLEDTRCGIEGLVGDDMMDIAGIVNQVVDTSKGNGRLVVGGVVDDAEGLDSLIQAFAESTSAGKARRMTSRTGGPMRRGDVACDMETPTCRSDFSMVAMISGSESTSVPSISHTKWSIRIPRN